MKLRRVVLAPSLALPGLALARNCPNLMAQVDTALAESPDPGEEMMKEIKVLREEGEMQHVAGEHGKSVESLNQALLLLGKL